MVKEGNHAGKGLDRQDAYLYGHPQGRKKRYRSPADFFLHLLWLGVDKEADPMNCSCEKCCPEKESDGVIIEEIKGIFSLPIDLQRIDDL